jgi:hypothetical protein
VRDGGTVLRFNGTPIGAATSRWDGAPRWTELTVYRLANGTYMISKIGRSLVAHSPSCPAAQSWRMPSWAEAGEEAKVRRVPCHECQPAIGDRMDPQTLLETTRYTVLRAIGPQTLLASLLRGRAGGHGRTETMAEIVHEVIRQVRKNDSAFAAWWDRTETRQHADGRG